MSCPIGRWGVCCGNGFERIVVTVAEKIRHAIASVPIATLAGTIEVTTSVGVSGLACFPDRSAVTADQLLSRADDCLYASKRNGRDRVTADVDLSSR